jgi:hypothetical protein
MHIVRCIIHGNEGAVRSALLYWKANMLLIETFIQMGMLFLCHAASDEGAVKRALLNPMIKSISIQTTITDPVSAHVMPFFCR